MKLTDLKLRLGAGATATAVALAATILAGPASAADLKMMFQGDP